MSTNAGLTWTVRSVPSGRGGQSDPSVATGKDGTLYLSYDDSDGAVMVAVSLDRGQTWTTPLDIGKRLGVLSTAFPVAVAGDGDRAAVAFLGTRSGGKAQDEDFGKTKNGVEYVGGEYHLYIATTSDRGVTWRAVDVTGKDPVQRGRICMGGTACSGDDRNLLDFMDITVDRQGRVLVGWADGCTGTCVESTLVAANRHTSQGRITRQSAGLPLFRTPPKLAS